jgi:hypothetical protein
VNNVSGPGPSSSAVRHHVLSSVGALQAATALSVNNLILLGSRAELDQRSGRAWSRGGPCRRSTTA